MSVTVDFQQLGMALGGLVVGTIAATVLVMQKTTLFQSRRHTARTDEYMAAISRSEFTLAMNEMRVKLDETAQQARDASAAAHAAQSALATVGQTIDAAMRALGDRLEGALRDIKGKVDGHDVQLFSAHGRLTAVETELTINRDGS